MSTPARRRRRIAGAVAVVAALAGAVVWWRLAAPAGPPLLAAGESLDFAQLEDDQPLPAFALAGDRGPITGEHLRGHWTYVFFGYTHCPNACPVTLAQLSQVRDALREQHHEAPGVLFVSLDPERDTPEILARYAQGFGAGIEGATGAAAALQPLVAFFGVSYERVPGKDAAHYTLDHTTNVFLVSPQGRWLATFPASEDAQSLIDDTQKLLRLRLPG